MEAQMENGDYVADGRGGIRRLSGAEAALQRALFLLTLRRGSFPFLPDTGSRLYLLRREKPGARAALARQYAAEALAGESGLTVTDVSVAEEEAGTLTLTAALSWQGQALSASVMV